MSANERIKARRNALGLSIDDVVLRLRPIWPTITAGMVSKTENEVRRVTLDEGRLWAYALDCSLDDLAEPTPQRYSPQRVRKRKD